ncbi:MAG: hypothetical protein U1E65_05325 [Myxococcota bacterium]
MKKQSLITAAMAGMMLSAVGAAHAAPARGPSKELRPGLSQRVDDQKGSDKHGCKGKNACKGKGGCKTEKHACKGQNACKGQGGCATDGSKK